MGFLVLYKWGQVRFKVSIWLYSERRHYHEADSVFFSQIVSLASFHHLLIILILPPRCQCFRFLIAYFICLLQILPYYVQEGVPLKINENIYVC